MWSNVPVAKVYMWSKGPVVKIPLVKGSVAKIPVANGSLAKVAAPKLVLTHRQQNDELLITDQIL